MSRPHYGLTRKEYNALVWIEAYLDDNDGVGPSYEEIRVAMNVTSKDRVYHVIKQLKRKGWIDNMPGIPRSLRIVRPTVDTCKHCGKAL